MHALLRTPFVPVLLLVITAPAYAETPYPDPIAPAVIGRPLDQIRPMRSAARHKPAVAKPTVAKPKRSHAMVAGMPVSPSPAARMGAAPAQLATVPAVAAAPAALPHTAKQALDDRYDPNAQVIDNVGQGTHFARKPLGTGAYLGSRYQEMVRKYYATHPAPGELAPWKVGEPLPASVRPSGVPDDLRAALPPVPPGYQYVQLAGEVVMVAVPSRMVVDGVSRGAR